MPTTQKKRKTITATRKRKKPSEIQSIAISKKYYTRAAARIQARKIINTIKKHSRQPVSVNAYKVDESPNWYRFRLTNPKKYKRIRTIQAKIIKKKPGRKRQGMIHFKIGFFTNKPI